MFIKKNKAGRKLKFKNVEELQKAIDSYFLKCDKTDRPYTIAGLAEALNVSRETIYAYSKTEYFSDTIARARTRINRYLEEKAVSGTGSSSLVFVMKNYGYSDKIGVDHTTNGDKINSSFALTKQQQLIIAQEILIRESPITALANTNENQGS